MNPFRSPLSFRQAATHVVHFRFEVVRVLFLAAVAAVLLVFGACSASQKAIEWAVVKDTTGAVCPILVQSLLTPAAAPLCVGLQELETVLQTLSGYQMTSSDAGTAGVVVAGPDALYQAILAHRAAEAAKASKK